MANWIDKYCNLILSGHQRHVLLSDPDGLTKYPEVISHLMELDVVIIHSTSPLDVRLKFELNIRKNQQKCLIILPDGYEPTPDMLQICSHLSIGLAQIFINFETEVLIGVDHDILFRLYNLKVYERLNTKETVDLVLKYSSSDEIEGLPEIIKKSYSTTIDKNNEIRLQLILEQLEDQSEDIGYELDHWLIIIKDIAEAKLRTLNTKDQNLIEKYKNIEKRLNSRFQSFLDSQYANIFSLSGMRRPAVVSRILEYVKAQPFSKKAIIVLDGMNYWQWFTVSQLLKQKGLQFTTKTTMSYIPSITAWSRQSIFRGDRPDLSENNSKEQKMFYDFFEKNGFNGHQIQYAKFGVSNKFNPEEISDGIKILGLVCNDLDDIMHGAIMGDAQLQNSTLQWVKTIGLSGIVQSLIKKGFKVFITTDHGNIEAEGIGNLTQRDKAGSITRSKRFMNFPNEVLKNEFIEKNPGLKTGMNGNSIFLRDKSAFALEGTKIVTHGGSHLFEILIPFIEIGET